ncbi:unnamed protein product [Oncorhynchus mykiss]|uniref:Uncharacterized protein n=1 Tax=Oncorhynchus mykiss TaxID=8022 RepID=A0A060YF10_ONCMY|nr:unnamed protein product [Oncorhynchus mykiss]
MLKRVVLKLHPCLTPCPVERTLSLSLSVQINVKEEEEEDEDFSTEEQEKDEDWENALSVERFGNIITDSAISGGEKMGPNYNEKDFEYHRHTFHHTHHPLSTHLPPPQRLRKRVLSMDRKRRRKKKRKNKKTSMAPSEVTPTIHEVDEEEESETEGRDLAATPTEQPDDQQQFSLGSEENLEPTVPLTSFHMESEQQHPPPEKATLATAEVVEGELEEAQQDIREQPEDEEGDEEPTNRCAQNQMNPLHPAPRTSYDMRERVCIGSMTAVETAVYRKVPTDEAEAQMLASSDLDDMKSKTHTYTPERTDRSQINPSSPPSCC